MEDVGWIWFSLDVWFGWSMVMNIVWLLINKMEPNYDTDIWFSITNEFGYNSLDTWHLVYVYGMFVYTYILGYTGVEWVSFEKLDFKWLF